EVSSADKHAAVELLEPIEVEVAAAPCRAECREELLLRHVERGECVPDAGDLHAAHIAWKGRGIPRRNDGHRRHCAFRARRPDNWFYATRRLRIPPTSSRRRSAPTTLPMKPAAWIWSSGWRVARLTTA